MKTNYHFEEFNLPRPDSRPYSLLQSADGNIWFVESKDNRIGCITLNGEITEYPTPMPDAEPHGLTVGIDGSIWFAEEEGKIGRIILE